MLHEEIKHIRAVENFGFALIELFIVKKHLETNKNYVWNGEKWIEHDIGTYGNGVLLDKNTLQQLVDDLWSCGIRPNSAKGSAGQLSAVQSHLNDMRAIVFNKLEVEKP
jgi:hypothetical protein